jgi:phosphatidylserine/phosphatidylglycerophosphate/cardiolipin synthase-like enzyme
MIGRWRFAALFGLCLFAASAAALEPGPRVFAAQGTIEVAFSPWDDTEGTVIRTIDGARREIYVQAFLFTSRKLAQALIAAQRRGVAVQVLADRQMVRTGKNSRIPELAAAGVAVLLETRYQAAHNKVIIVDPAHGDGAVLTGSYNFTTSAHRKNAENVIVLRGDPALRRAYLDNWLRHRADAVPYERDSATGR